MNSQEKVGLVTEVFDTIAPSYDRMNLIMTWGMLPFWQKKVMSLTELPLGGRAIDLCCGTGEMTFQLAQRAGAFGEAIGVDFSEEMLDCARQKQVALGIPHVQFVQGDALAIPQPNNAFDAATSGFALRNVTNIPLAIQEMARVVRPGGRVVCIDVSRPLFPPARLFFNWYYFKVVPKLGDKLVSKQLVGDRYAPYTWLAESLRDFPNRKEICRYYREAGLVDIQAKSVGFGAATIYSGTKPARGANLVRQDDLPVRVRAFIAKITELRKKLLF